MGDALRKQKKDVTKFSMDINSDGTLTFHSDGWPDLKLKKQALTVAALSGTYEGKVGGGLILDMTVKFNGDGTMDFDNNVKVAARAPCDMICDPSALLEEGSGEFFRCIDGRGDDAGDAGVPAKSEPSTLRTRMPEI